MYARTLSGIAPTKARLLPPILISAVMLSTSALLAACGPAPRPPLDVSAPPMEHEALGEAHADEGEQQGAEEASPQADGAPTEAEADVTENGVEVADAPVITPAAAVEAGPSPTALALNEVSELEDFLQEEGIALTFNQEVKLDYLPGMARIYEIGSGTDSLQLHAYSSVEETDEAAGCFSPDAMFIEDLEDPGNPFKVEWMGSPHVYRSQNLLATYIGDDPDILDALSRAFGPQFAGY